MRNIFLEVRGKRTLGIYTMAEYSPESCPEVVWKAKLTNVEIQETSKHYTDGVACVSLLLAVRFEREDQNGETPVKQKINKA